MTIEEIKTAQKEHKISDKLLCEISGVSVPTWWRYRQGISEPSFVKLQKLDSAIDRILFHRGVLSTRQKHVLEHKK